MLLREGLDLLLLLGALGLDVGVRLHLKRTQQALVHQDSCDAPHTPKPTVATTILMLVSRPSCKLLQRPTRERLGGRCGQQAHVCEQLLKAWGPEVDTSQDFWVTLMDVMEAGAEVSSWAREFKRS